MWQISLNYHKAQTVWKEGRPKYKPGPEDWKHMLTEQWLTPVELKELLHAEPKTAALKLSTISSVYINWKWPRGTCFKLVLNTENQTNHPICSREEKCRANTKILDVFWKRPMGTDGSSMKMSLARRVSYRSTSQRIFFTLQNIVVFLKEFGNHHPNHVLLYTPLFSYSSSTSGIRSKYLIWLICRGIMREKKVLILPKQNF